MNSSQWVFVLGAGASREAGYPLVREMLSARFLEQLFDACERGERAAGAGPEFIRKWRAWALEECEHFTRTGEQDVEQLLAKLTRENDSDRIRLQQYVATVLSVGRYLGSHYERWAAASSLATYWAVYSHQVTILTFNYDLLADWCLQFKESATRKFLNYGFAPTEYLDTSDVEGLWLTATNPITPPYSGSVPLLKLHGSLNWGLCPACGKLTIFPTEIGSRFLPDNFTKACRGCSVVVDEPFIVPPSREKQIHPRLKSIWLRARAALSQAQKVVFIGYSMPEYDEAAYDLFRSTCSEFHQVQKQLYVVDPVCSQQLIDRYRSISRRTVFMRQSLSEYAEEENAISKRELDWLLRNILN